MGKGLNIGLLAAGVSFICWSLCFQVSETLACGPNDRKPVPSWRSGQVEKAADGRSTERQQLLVDGIPVYGWQRRVLVSQEQQELSVPAQLPACIRQKTDLHPEVIVLPKFPQNWQSITSPSLYWIIDAENLRLVYITEGHYSSDIRRMQLISDAATGSIIELEYVICSLNATGTANTMYSGIKSIVTNMDSPAHFTLNDNSRGKGIETLDLNHQTGYFNVTGYADSDNIWNNGEPVQVLHAADAHYGAGAFYDYLMSAFGRNSLDNQGMKLISYLNYGNNFVNAFWNGNAVVYGSGNSSYGPMTTIDIAGHEFAHGLIQEMTGLHHNGEPGIIQEALADIFGTALEWHEGTTPADWTIGEDNGNPVRSMSDPGLFNHPDTYLGSHWYYGTGDNGGVHINCGFINKWFYLLSQGGTGTNDHGTGYSVQGIGIQNAVKLVYDVMQTRLVPQTGFSEFMNYTIQEARIRFGTCSPEMNAVVDAWKAVGLYSDPVTGLTVITPLPHCEGTAVELNFTGAVFSDYSWTRNGNPVTLSVIGNTARITQSGTYILTENRCGNIISTLPVQIDFSPLPEIHTSPITTCPGIPVVLTALPIGGQFNVPNPYGGPSAVYEYTFTNSYGCTSTKTDSIIVHEVPALNLSIPEDTLYRDSSPVELSANQPGNWTGTGIQQGWFYPDLAGYGVHTLAFHSLTAEGCQVNGALGVSVLEQCRPFDNEMMLHGPDGFVAIGAQVKLSIKNLATGYTVEWHFPEEYETGILQGNEVTFKAAYSKNPITAIVTNTCGESIRFQSIVNVSREPVIQLYPNPASHVFFLSAEGMRDQEYRYEITDIAGNLVGFGTAESGPVSKIETTGFSPGVYFVGIVGSGKKPEKLLIQKP